MTTSELKHAFGAVGPSREQLDDMRGRIFAEPARAGRPLPRRLAAVLAAAVLAVALPAAAFAAVPGLNGLLYQVLPDVAMALRPVHESSERQGIRVEVARVYNDETAQRTYAELTLTDEWGQNRTQGLDLYDSYWLDGRSGFGILQKSYDPARQQATLLLAADRVDQQDGPAVRGGKMSFHLRTLYYGRQDRDTALADLADLAVAGASTEPLAGYWSGYRDEEHRDAMQRRYCAPGADALDAVLNALAPGQNPLHTEEADWLEVESAVVEDGMLRVRYTRPRLTPDEAFFYVAGSDGQPLAGWRGRMPADGLETAFFSDSGSGDRCTTERLIRLPAGTPLAELQLRAYVWDYSGKVEDRWDITFRLPET